MNRIAVLLVAAGGLGASELGNAFLAFSPEIRPYRVVANAGIDAEPERGLDDGDGDYARQVWRVGARAQAWANDRHEVVLSGSWSESTAQTDARLPELGGFPDRLYETRLGAQYRYVGADRSVYGGSFALGSADRDPYSDGDGLSVVASLFMRYPLARDAWLLSLYYTNDAPVLNNVPIPGLVYEWKPDPALSAYIGFPFSAARRKATERWTFDGSGTVFGTVHVGAGFTLLPAAGLRATAAFDHGSETWKWPGALDDDQRIYFRSTRATAGLAWDRGPLVGATVYGGWAFDRDVIVGESIRDRDDQLDLPGGAAVGATLRAGF